MGYVGMVWDWETLCGTHLVSVTWAPNGEPMWADHVGPIGNISGLSGHGVELGKTMWDPFGFCYMGATWGTHVG